MKILKRFLLVLIVTYVAFIFIAPPILISDRNKTTLKKPYTTSSHASTLFQSLDFVGDLHCDALLWKRNLTKESDIGHVDFPRMQKGNMAFQAFTIVTKSPTGQNITKNSGEAFDMITPLSIGQGQSVSTWFSLLNRALYQCKKLHKFSQKYNNKFIIIKSKKDFKDLLDRRAKDKSVIGGLLGIEGAHCLEGKIDNFDKLYEAGVRMMGPAHFFDNELGGSAHGVKQGGLTGFGQEVVKKMAEKNMIMDLAHSSVKVIDDILRTYNGPILSSHTGVHGTKKSPRNLSDKQLRQIANKGGLIGIGYFHEAIGNEGIKGIVNAMRYTKNLVGVEHVTLGSDYDGSVTVPFDTTGLALLVDEMLKQGFTTEEIKLIMGENLKRFLLANLT